MAAVTLTPEALYLQSGRCFPYPLRARHEPAFQQVQMVAPLVGTVAAVVFSCFYGMPRGTLAITLLLGTATGLGITVGFHRLFTHRSFAAGPGTRAVLAVLGTMAAQGTLYSWVGGHRRHHHFSDRPGDPHSPVAADGSWRERLCGMWHAHVGWMLDAHLTPECLHHIPDLIADRTLARVQRYYLWWVALGLMLPALAGYLIVGTWQAAVAGLLWGGFVRIAVTDHISFGLNSACHLWGARPFEAQDESRNNAVMAVLAFGEGWHNNHHAFPTSARHGLRWWQIDLSYTLIRLLARCGLAWNIQTPTAAQIEAKLRAVTSETAH
jgi:stearoyl-CoA desaturase (delta-9 desaturase)